MGTYSSEQLKWIKNMLYLDVGYHVSFDNIQNYLEELEDDITESALDVTAQQPIMMGLLVGKTVYQYWISELNVQQSKWDIFFTSPRNVNYGNIGIWVRSAIEGALIGSKVSKRGMVALTTDIVSTEIVSFIAGTLIIGTGRVIFKWAKRLLPVIYDNERMEGGFSESEMIVSMLREKSNDKCFNKGCTNKKICTDSGCTNNCPNTYPGCSCSNLCS